MRNITVAVSDDSYRQARIWAAKNDTSVSAVAQDLLLNLPGLARVARTFTAGLPTPTPPQQTTSRWKQTSFSGGETVEAILANAESIASKGELHRSTPHVNL
jgi:hypothetical protein